MMGPFRDIDQLPIISAGLGKSEFLIFDTISFECTLPLSLDQLCIFVEKRFSGLNNTTLTNKTLGRKVLRLKYVFNNFHSC